LEMREWAVRIPFRGAWRPSTAPAQQGGGGHGWRRPWGRRGSPLCLASRWGEEKQGERDKMVADGWGPLGSETSREMKGWRAGWLWWADRVGGLAAGEPEEDFGVV
jgi:hypothetical protein